MGTSEPIISSRLVRKREKLAGVYSNRKGVYPVRIHGNYLCEVAEIQVSRVLAADDGDDEEDDEDEDEERRHDDEEDEEEEEEESVWTILRINAHKRE
jgi:hypothetical protein